MAKGEVEKMQSASLENREPSVGSTDRSASDGAAETWVLFLLDEQTYGLHIWEVERIVRAVEVKSLPESPPHIRGIVNVQGQVLPVVDLRVRFGRPTRDIRLEDHFIIARTGSLALVLPVDAAFGSVEVHGGSDPIEDESQRCLRKVVTLDGEAIYALDLQRVLFPGRDEAGVRSILADLPSA
jgi:chemotaxis signal transduction protein